jgi:ABC-2 type transport system ATP-binding protein
METNMIHFEEVTKLYGSVIGVNDINLSLELGSYGLLGPNGSGKTTLLNLITGQLQATQGRVELFGASPILEKEVLHRIGFCPAVDLLQTNVSGLDWVSYLLELQGFDRQEAARKADEALDLVGLEEGRHRAIGGYSRGMKQRCKLAQAIAHDPDLLILDEPFTGVDPVGRHGLSEIFRQWVGQGKSLLVASHVLHEVEAICESFLLICDGRLLASGSAYEVHSLLANVPNQIRFRTNRPREMAEVLLQQGLIDMLDLDEGAGRLSVSTSEPARLYEQLPVLSKQGIEIQEMHSGDDSLQAVFDSLLRIHRGEI